MRQALALASEAAERNEVPVGAIVVHKGNVVGRGSNRTIELRDPTAHAELLAIRDACKRIESDRLLDCQLYSTLEPCPMCAGAILLARCNALYFGAHDLKWGATGTLYSITNDRRLNHVVPTFGGLLDVESTNLLSTFFSEKR